MATRVTKYGEGERLDGHDNYGLIYDSVSVKMGILVAIEIFSKEISSYLSAMSNVVTHVLFSGR